MSQINVSEKPLRIAFPAGRLLGVLLAATLLAAIACPPLVAQAPPTKPKTAQPPAGKDAAPQADPSAAFFRDGVVPHLSIVISQPEMQKLRDKNREYVRCTIVEDGRAQYERVAIHLKGGAGSFRSIDDKPAMTIKFNKFEKEQLFHGLDKINVNNSVQDPGYLDELICGELFTMAGIPAPRVTHARVKLNGRDLGIFVLKEGFDKKFVKRNGLDPKGNLYEGGFVQDLDGQPRLQSGEGPDDLSDVKAVVAACREPDLSKRWPKMEQVIEIDRFITFMAVELMCCHWDGYCNNHNY
jgi:spore coat protein H